MGPGTGRSTRRAAPPPPVRQGASLANCTQGCPLQQAGDCAVLELEVDVTTFSRSGQGNDRSFAGMQPTDPRFHAAPVLGTPTHLILKTDRQKRGQRTSIRDGEIRNLLSRYDLVLDTLADGPSRDDPWPRGRIALDVRAKFGGKCSEQRHPAIYEIPLTVCRELPPGGAYWEKVRTDQRKFYAPGIWADTLSSTTPFGFFMSMLAQLTCAPKLIDIRAKACGASHWYAFRRDPDIDLACLLRIFRKDKWGLKLKIASYRTTSVSHTNYQGGWRAQGNPNETEGTTRTTTRTSTTGGTTQTTQRKQTSGFRDRAADGTTTPRASADVTTQSTQNRNLLATRSTTTSTNNGSGGNALAVTHHDIPGGQHQEFVVTRDGRPPKGDGWQRVGDGYVRTVPQESPPPRVDLTITRNGQPLNILEDLRKFIEGVMKLRDTINRFAELLRKAPQVGWSFGYSFAFLEGSVEGTIERVQASPPTAQEGRYIGVGWKGTVTFQLMLVSFSATASFGIKLDVGWLASAEATLNGTFKTEIPLRGTVNTEGDCEIGLHPTVTAEISGVLKASAVGVQIVDVRVTLTGGITIMDARTRKPGGLTWKNKGGGFGFKGDLCTTDIVLKVVATSAAGGVEPSEYNLLGPHTLMNLAQQPSHN